MGQCISSTTRERPSNYRFSDSLATETPSEKELHRLTFHADIANVVLKKYPYRIARPVFHFKQGQGFALEAKSAQRDEALKWKIQQKCDFEMSEHELRRNCLEVEVHDDSNRIVGRLSINLFLIATGPFLQDFAIEFENGTVGRMSFDLRLSQVIELGVHSLAAEVELLRDHPGQEFSFAIQTIAPIPSSQAALNGQTFHSRHSYSAPVLLQKKVLELSHQENQNKDLHQNELKVSVKEVERGRMIFWKKQQGELPTLTTRVLASQLHNTYFQILIWKHAGNQNYQFFADTYVSFYKLFASDAQRQGQGGKERECRNISITEKIQHYGKDYGKGLFSFRIDNDPYFKQYQICVHTERGILKTAPIFAQESPSQVCSELEQLQLTSELIEQSVIRLSGCQSRTCSLQQVKKIKAEIQINLEKIFHLLEKTSHRPAFLYRYGSEEALLRGQKILVTVGARSAQYLQLQDPVINDVCWLILISLAKRAEFSLSHMGFHEQEKQLIRRGSLSPYLKEKMNLVAVYRSFTCRMLALALNALNRKGSQYESTFAEVYCACAYFKVPEFRKELLSLLERPQDPEIEEWRGLEFNLRDDIAEGRAQDGDVFGELFDWHQQCYAWIGEEGQVRQALTQEGWRERFRQRGQEFFYFLKYWVTYIESHLPPEKDIQWRYFPGYNRLLLALFAEMKRIPVLEYPDAMLQSCTKLLANEKLVNPLMAIVLNRVNAYEITTVLKGVDFLSQLFFTFSTKKRPLPVSFSYSYFFKVIKIIFEGESSLEITSLLTLLYTHFALFHSSFRRSLSMYMLGSVFWRLFMHWSYTVRYCFQHLIAYRIYGQAYLSKKTPYYPQSNVADISEADIMGRYKLITKLMAQKESQCEDQASQGQDFVNGQHYYKRMRMKIFQKMRRSQRNSSIGNTKEENSTKQLTSAHTFSLKIESSTASSLKIQRMHPYRQREYHSEYELAKRVPLPTRALDDNSPVKFFSNIILFQKVIPDEEFQLQQLPAAVRKRVGAYLAQFKAVEKSFIRWLEGEGSVCPPLNYQFQIDNREIRPKQMENW